MKGDKLTDNGIDKLVGGIFGVTLQVLNVIKKKKGNKDFYSCDLSDGYCKLKGCLVVDQEVFTKNKIIQENLVIVVIRGMINQNRQKQPICIVEKYQVETDRVNQVVGKPINYDEFIKKGKNNPDGNNNYQIFLGQSHDYQDLLDDQKDEEETLSHPIGNTNKSSNLLKPAEKKETAKNAKPNTSKGGLRLSSDEQETKPNPKENTTTNSRTNNFKDNQLSKQTSNNTSRPKQQQSPPAKNKNNKLKGPIEKVERRSSPAVRGNQNRPQHEYNYIKDLFIGMENFVLLVRVIFVFPVKTFINKKGVESCLLNILVGDKSGTIECTMFGELVQRFEGRLKEDQIFELANAAVSEGNYLGNRYNKLIINETSKVSLKEDDPSVPFSEDYCITVKKLVDAPVGSENMVVCLVKDTQKAEDFTTKAGKDMRKKLIYLCDPEQKVEVEMTLFGDKCDDIFENQPYMFKGVNVGQFKGNRQYSLKGNSAYRPLKYHTLRKYIKDIDNIEFTNPDSNKKQRGSLTSNLKDLMNSMDEINEKGSWSEVVCTVSSFKTNPPPFYLACPHCKKKVSEEQGQCHNCGKNYDQTIYKFMVHFSICDQYETLWTMGFDEVSHEILGVSAQEYSRMNEEEVQELVNKVRFKEIKVRMITKSEVYNNEERKKTNMIKVLDLNYAEEAKIILNRLQHLVGGNDK